MRVIPVIDLMNGQVVRGIAGRRSEYRPIQSQIAADARPATVARAFVERFGLDTVYVADLDAIVHSRPNAEAWNEISNAGLTIWLDAGVGPSNLGPCNALQPRDERLKAISAAGILIIALESLPTPGILIDFFLPEIRKYRELKFAFSLDLNQGRPLTHIQHWKDEPPIVIARWAMKVGVERLIVLDLADVGVSSGSSSLALCREIRREFPAVELVAGGGVRGLDDLKALAGAGCDAALVASALHDGRISADDIRLIENLHR